MPLFLLRWLLFRLILLSGLVKLASGDPTWRGLEALRFHYWTQPLPSPLSPLAHALSPALHAVSTAGTLAIELVLPFGVFGPRGLRRIAAAGIAALQIVINATGNYGFFGLLTGALCVLLVDDAIWRRVPGVHRLAPEPAAPFPGPGPTRRALGVVAGVVVMVLTAAHAVVRLAPRVELPSPLEAALRLAAPLGSFHAYGLFATMTTDRPEIEVEATLDGVEWRPYEFRWKPDRLDVAPRFAGLHMPRLDWQMWFAALGSCTRNPWFLAFQQRLLEADPAVLGLLARDPVGGKRPLAVRSRLWRYRFADTASRRAGTYWTREALGPYCPPLALDRAGRLRRADR